MGKINYNKAFALLNECWKPVEGYEGLYEVSTNGGAKSLNYNKTGKEKILKPGKNKQGYLYINLWKNGKGKAYKIHRLVAQTFLPNPDNLPCVNHKDENKTNNHYSNLEWCTYKENINWGTANERRSKTKTNGKKSKAIISINPSTREIIEFPSTQEAKRKGYNQGQVAACCRGERKTHKGLIWCFKGTSDEEINKRMTEYLPQGLPKPVQAINPNTGEVVAEYISIAEAGRNGYDHSSVSACCRGEYKHHKGLVWKFK